MATYELPNGMLYESDRPLTPDSLLMVRPGVYQYTSYAQAQAAQTIPVQPSQVATVQYAPGGASGGGSPAPGPPVSNPAPGATATGPGDDRGQALVLSWYDDIASYRGKGDSYYGSFQAGTYWPTPDHGLSLADYSRLLAKTVAAAFTDTRARAIFDHEYGAFWNPPNLSSGDAAIDWFMWVTQNYLFEPHAADDALQQQVLSVIQSAVTAEAQVNPSQAQAVGDSLSTFFHQAVVAASNTHDFGSEFASAFASAYGDWIKRSAAVATMGLQAAGPAAPAAALIEQQLLKATVTDPTQEMLKNVAIQDLPPVHVAPPPSQAALAVGAPTLPPQPTAPAAPRARPAEEPSLLLVGALLLMKSAF